MLQVFTNKAMMTRRDFLKTVSAAMMGVMASSCTPEPKESAAKVSKYFGLQIYGMGPELENDLPNGFRTVKEMGYSTLELAGYREGKVGMFAAPIDIMEYRRMAEEAGLTISSSHVRPSLRAYTEDNKSELLDFWKKTLDDHVKLGVKYLIQPALPQCRSLEETQHVAALFNEVGQLSKAAGIEWGLHNDAGFCYRVAPGGEQSLYLLEGRYPEGSRQIMDVLLEETDPALVTFEYDCMAAVQGFNDPVEYLQRYPQRFHLLHVRDYAALGQSGMLNYERIFRQFHANGYADFYVEDENARSGHQTERLRESAAYLMNAEFV